MWRKHCVCVRSLTKRWFLPSNLRALVKSTVRAGMFMPMANVSVANSAWDENSKEQNNISIISTQYSYNCEFQSSLQSYPVEFSNKSMFALKVSGSLRFNKCVQCVSFVMTNIYLVRTWWLNSKVSNLMCDSVGWTFLEHHLQSLAVTLIRLISTVNTSVCFDAEPVVPWAGLQRKGSLWSLSGWVEGLHDGFLSPSSTVAAHAPPDEHPGQREEDQCL